MTQEEKSLLLRDLCARLPYGVIVHLEYDENTSVTRELGIGSLHDIMMGNAEGKPYLRPISSMTEEEDEKWWSFSNEQTIVEEHVTSIQYLLENHFDFIGLIPKGLAIKVTKDNNPYE